MRVDTALTNLNKRFQMKEEQTLNERCPMVLWYKYRDDGTMLYGLGNGTDEKKISWLTEEEYSAYRIAYGCDRQKGPVITFPFSTEDARISFHKRFPDYKGGI